MKPLPQGKGLYVWAIKSMPANWVQEFKNMGIRWIAVKVADGVNSFNLRRKDGGGWADDILPSFIDQARAARISVGGWGYVYGFNPLDEADKAAQRINKFDLDFFLIDAEREYYNKPTQASQYSKLLRSLAPQIPIALSSYRFPDKFPQFPFAQFLEYCDFNAPQVYWNKGKSVTETQMCLEQYTKIHSLPFIPAGRAYFGEGFPVPTPAEIFDFLLFNNHNFCAAFFWSADFLYHRLHKQKMAPIREAIAAYKWESTPDNNSNNGNGEPDPEPVEMPLNGMVSLDLDGYEYEGVIELK